MASCLFWGPPQEQAPEARERPADAEPGGDFDDDFDDDDEPEDLQPVHNDCRCGECCRRLLIEVSQEDAEREPKIKERGDPIYADPRLTRSGKPELEGYLLNRKENAYACTFLDPTTSLCSIYETRPWVCRVFDCDGQGKEQLIQLGYRPGDRGR
jgi:Fe-S-cluster containining protein